MTNGQLKSLCTEVGLTVLPDKLKKLELLVDLFIEKNKVINLTKINSREEFLIKHILDSLLVDRFLGVTEGARVADLGTGGGLPGLVLAILHPEAKFFLVDSVQKKIACVGEFASALGLGNVRGVSERLEVLGQDKNFRETFDIVIARALAPLPVLLELALPLVRVGGTFAALKGPGYLEEISDSGAAAQQFKIDLPRAERYELPKGTGKRYVLIFDKKKPTPPQFPRRVGVPNKKSL